MPITEADELAMDLLRAPDTPERAALAEILGDELSGEPSESEVLRALLAVGRMAVEAKAAEAGYASAYQEQDDEDRAFHRAMRARRRGDGD